VKRFLICARYPADVGVVIPVLEDAGCKADLVFRKDGYKGASFDLSRHIGLIILGDGKRRADNKVYEPERLWVRAALESDKAVLGICHGAQLLADIGGGKLKGWPSETDAGLTRLKLTERGERDPVIGHVKGAQVAQCHLDTFEVPEGAVDLASSPNHKRPHSDAFRIGSNVYGPQFHPEPDATMLLGKGRHEWGLNVPDEVAAAVEQTGRKVLRAWVEIARGG
jgi:GMP synthase-like glutamine amidotransferase